MYRTGSILFMSDYYFLKFKAGIESESHNYRDFSIGTAVESNIRKRGDRTTGVSRLTIGD